MLLKDVFSPVDVETITRAKINKLSYKLDLFSNNERRTHSIDKVLSQKDTFSYTEFYLDKKSLKQYREWKNTVAYHHRLQQGKRPSFTLSQSKKR